MPLEEGDGGQRDLQGRSYLGLIFGFNTMDARSMCSAVEDPNYFAFVWHLLKS